jgi:hypothetical protein
MRVETPKSLFRTILPAIIAVVAFSVGVSESEEGSAVDLTRYRWENRLLLVFAPTHGEPSFEALHESVAARGPDIEDRDLVVFEVLEDGPSTRDGETLNPAAARLLRERFDVPSGAFSVILVGKDGGVKLQRQDRTSLEEIFALIDTMPMRQREMRRENPPNQ